MGWVTGNRKAIDSALRGDWQGLLTSLVSMAYGDGAGDGLKRIGRSIFDSLGGSSSGSSGGFRLSSIGSSIATMFKGFPDFADGGTEGRVVTGDSLLAAIERSAQGAATSGNHRAATILRHRAKAIREPAT